MTNYQPCENPSGAGNEQGSPTTTDLAWLAGHFDGEGWVGLNKTRRTETQYVRFSAQIALATTNFANADRVRSILEAGGVYVRLREIRPKPTENGTPRSHQWDVRICSNRETAKALDLMRPYLTGKAKQADLVREYVAWRESQPSRPGRYGVEVSREIQARGEECRRLLKIDRQWGDPSTTTRSAPDPRFG